MVSKSKPSTLVRAQSPKFLRWTTYSDYTKDLGLSSKYLFYFIQSLGNVSGRDLHNSLRTLSLQWSTWWDLRKLHFGHRKMWLYLFVGTCWENKTLCLVDGSTIKQRFSISPRKEDETKPLRITQANVCKNIQSTALTNNPQMHFLVKCFPS